ncbi:MAG: hypothetical protein K8R87_12250, partial [Verrucomicrobia bacterium]|nr:hypothetical protein [Verrucomicrobiota bacterium]
MSLTCGLCSAQSPRHPEIDGFSADLSIDYDGSRFRTAPLHVGFDVEWRGEKSWISLELDGYPDFSRQWQFSQDFYAGVTVGTALYKSHEDHFYINASLNL